MGKSSKKAKEETQLRRQRRASKNGGDNGRRDGKFIPRVTYRPGGKSPKG